MEDASRLVAESPQTSATPEPMRRRADKPVSKRGLVSGYVGNLRIDVHHDRLVPAHRRRSLTTTSWSISTTRLRERR